MTSEDEKILAQAKRHLEIAWSAESENREEMLDDLRFCALDQWPESVKSDRSDRPMLVLDHVGQTIRKIIGDIRQNMPGIKIHPVDSGSDVDNAKIMEGLIRQIQATSRASEVFLNAAEDCVKMGYGVWRVCTEYTSFDSFEQDITIKPVRNPFSVYFDPAAERKTKEDGRFVIVTEMISKELFEQQYGSKVEMTDFDSRSTGDSEYSWYDDDQIRVAEYYVKKPVKKRIVGLSDGTTVDADSIDDEKIAVYAEAGITPVREREVDSYDIHYYKLTGSEVIETNIWPGRNFPVIPVYGLEDFVDGRTNYRGATRAAKDPQRLYNYWHSAAAETIALQPKAPFLVTANQIKNYKDIWDRANIDNNPYLVFEPDPQNPTPPQRMSPPAMQSGLLQQAGFAAEDIKAATGVYDASLGARSNETSGRAILARQSEAELGTSVFLYNLSQSIEQTAKVLLDIIPSFYDTQRVIKVLGEDNSVEDVLINSALFTPDGLQMRNDLTRGKYDVRVSIGPNYKTRRQEAANSMVEMARVFPQLTQVAGDLIAQNLDWPGADAIAERLKKLMPPGIADDDEQSEEQMAMAQQQMQQQQAAMAIEIKSKVSDIQNKDADTAKKMSETRQNQIENLVEAAEIAQEHQNVALQNQALLQLVQMLQSNQQVLQ